MKRTPLKRKTPLKAKTPLKSRASLKSNTTLKAHKPMNKVSKKKREEIEAEKPTRKELIERSQGRCEECGEIPPYWIGLHPHEEKFRSSGGKLSASNSKMLCPVCHSAKHHIKVIIHK